MSSVSLALLLSLGAGSALAEEFTQAERQAAAPQLQALENCVKTAYESQAGQHNERFNKAVALCETERLELLAAVGGDQERAEKAIWTAMSRYYR